MTRRRTVALFLAVASSLAATVAASATVPQAAQRVRAAVPAMEFYAADNGMYAGATVAKLRSIDRSIRDVVIKRATKSAYCLESTLPGPVVHFAGPKGPVRRGPCGVRGAVVPQPRPAPSAATTAVAAAKEQLRMAVPAIEVYALDNGGYVGMTLARIREIDAGISAIRVVWATARAYCIESGSGAATHHRRGSAQPIVAGRCPAAP